jgi:hypothetical protein
MPSTRPVSSCAVSVGLGQRVRRDAGLRGRQIDDPERRVEQWQRAVHAARSVGDERPAVEDQLVVAAYLIHEHDRHVMASSEPRDHPAPLARLARVPRRARRVQDQVGAGARELATGSTA